MFALLLSSLRLSRSTRRVLSARLSFLLSFSFFLSSNYFVVLNFCVFILVFGAIFINMSTKIPRVRPENHAAALAIINDTYPLSEVRSVAMIFDQYWSVNVKDPGTSRFKVCVENSPAFHSELQRLFAGVANVHGVDPMMIWLPNSQKKIWSFDLSPLY